VGAVPIGEDLGVLSAEEDAADACYPFHEFLRQSCEARAGIPDVSEGRYPRDANTLPSFRRASKAHDRRARRLNDQGDRREGY
jgi:hypothetical protein